MVLNSTFIPLESRVIVMEDLINLMVHNGIGVVCVCYLIYFQQTTMNKLLETMNSIDKRLALIESKVDDNG